MAISFGPGAASDGGANFGALQQAPCSDQLETASPRPAPHLRCSVARRWGDAVEADVLRLSSRRGLTFRLIPLRVHGSKSHRYSFWRPWVGGLQVDAE